MTKPNCIICDSYCTTKLHIKDNEKIGVNLCYHCFNDKDKNKFATTFVYGMFASRGKTHGTR